MAKPESGPSEHTQSSSFSPKNSKNGIGIILPITASGISSIAGTKGLGSAPAYSATKRMQNTYIDALAQLSRMENCGIRFTDIRPGFVATPLLSGDGRYPMLMRTEKVAARIMHVLRHPRRRVVIDRRYALMVFFWKLIPEWLWERLNIRKDD